MLLRFSVENFRSIRDLQELSLIASGLDDDTSGLLETDAAEGNRVLPTLVIYGANASGKSTIISALRWMRAAVVESHRRGEPGGPLAISPFRLDEESRHRPSKFSADFVVDQIRYHYGFEAGPEAFLAEWLFAYPNGRRQALFERAGTDFTFGRSLKGQNKVIAGLTRPNSLFLSASMQNGHEQLSKVGSFFQKIQVDLGESSQYFLKGILENKVDDRILDFLERIGTGVSGYRVREVKRPEHLLKVMNEIDALFKKHFNDFTEVATDVSKEIEFRHHGEDKKDYYLRFEDESDGTQRLFFLLARVFQALGTGSLLLVDELEASLHTQASEAVLALFAGATVNKQSAQLIATTHDTNLLRSGAVRRDQVWFTEKDGLGRTHLYPLSDFRTRKGDNIEKGYLQGRYGAVPFSGLAQDLIEAL